MRCLSIWLFILRFYSSYFGSLSGQIYFKCFAKWRFGKAYRPIPSKCKYYHLASFSRAVWIVWGHNRLFDTKFDKIASVTQHECLRISCDMPLYIILRLSPECHLLRLPQFYINSYKHQLVKSTRQINWSNNYRNQLPSTSYRHLPKKEKSFP